MTGRRPTGRSGAGGSALWADAWRQLDAAVVITDGAGRIVEWNDGATRLFGWTSAEAIGQSWSQLAGPTATDPDPRRAEIDRRRGAGEGYTGELTVSTKAGHRLPIIVSGGPIRDAQGRIAGSIGIAIDDSRRSLAEERFEVAFHAAPVASVITSGDRQLILDVNQAFEQLSGIARHDAIGRTTNELGLWDDPAMSAAVLELTRAQATVQDQRIRFRVRDGTVAHARVSGRPIALSDGPAYLWMALDETERVAAEERVQAAAARLTAVVDASPLAICLLDADQRVQLWNPAAERLLGWSADEVLGRVNPIRSHDPSETRRLVDSVQATGEAGTIVVTLIDRLGRDVRVELSLAPVIGADGAPAGILAMGADVSERERLTERLQLAQRMEAVGVLAGGIAHDINNTMTAIGGNAALAARLLEPDHPATEDLAEIVRATERAADLTRQLLAFSRRSVIRPEVLDLAEEARSMEGMLRRLIGPSIELEVLAPGPAWVKADPGQMHQVLLNLAVNARDAMPGGGTVRIQVDETTEAVEGGAVDGAVATAVRLTVVDTGSGIDDDVLAHMFEPFFTTKPPGQGTGLGLAVVHGIIEQAGGRIEVDSRPGAGTMFEVTLPRVRVDAEGSGEENDGRAMDRPGEGRRPVGAEATTTAQATILLVEDEPSIRALARRVLQSRGHRVVEAEDGVAGLERARATPELDLVLTDLTMPRMGGEELARHLAEVRPKVPIVYMSGYGEARLTEDGVLDPSIRLLAKPFGIDALVQIVEEALRAG
jgi:two-component system cell cycle sensor histidine kinase/response regulator CckA